MRILVLGATGTTGSLLVDVALAAGHEVTALVRNRQKLPERRGLQVVAGDVRRVEDLVGAAKQADALVSTLGVGSTRTPNDLILDVTRSVITAAGETGLRRVLFQSAFGTGASHPKSSVFLRLGYRLAPAVFQDKAAGEELLMVSGLDWTIVYPGVLTNGPRSGKVTATDLAVLQRLPGVPRIARADVAEFLLDVATTGSWNQRMAVLSVRK